KIGGEGLPVAHIVKNNIAFDNNMDGFTDNFNPGKVLLENNTSFDNKRFNFIFRSNPYFEDEEMGIFKNNLSFRTTESGISDFIAGNVNETNFFYDGEKTVNSNGVVVDSSHFVSIVAPETFARDTNGNIIMGDFLKLTRKSLLNRAGENRGHVGAKMEASQEHPRRSVTPPGPPSTPPGKLR
ncbi:MAG: hypothetical protein LPK00_06145, partial [Bacillaceae bacterium]|nr:hypothetical protein [Bacillaceae bacterium]